jgi:hypothetical protein
MLSDLKMVSGSSPINYNNLIGNFSFELLSIYTKY